MAKPVRHQQIDLGGRRAVKHGAPWGPGDIYYELMEMGWPAFVAVVTTIFFVVNLGFGAVYAAMPGAIEHMTTGSVAEGFFFSVETLATVGYGNMAPATHAGHAVAVVEILTGLFMTATLTGLIFSRFARPRDSLMFSTSATVAMIGGRRLLMLRLAGTRVRPMADVTASLAVLETVRLPTGREYRRNADLPLLNPHNAVMALAWSLVHVIDDDSALKTAIDAHDDTLWLTVTVRGLDTLTSNAIFSSHVYRRADIRHDAEFVDIFDNRDDGSIHLDLTRLHETRPASRDAVAPD